MVIDEMPWNAPVTIEEIRADRGLLPTCPGLYVFTNYAGILTKNTGVLYIGKAKSLRTRVSSYLTDPTNILLFSPRKKDQKLSRSLRHTGKTLLLTEIQQRSRFATSGIWLRWMKHDIPAELEGILIEYFEPAFNTSLNPRTRK